MKILLPLVLSCSATLSGCAGAGVDRSGELALADACFEKNVSIRSHGTCPAFMWQHCGTVRSACGRWARVEWQRRNPWPRDALGWRETATEGMHPMAR